MDTINHTPSTYTQDIKHTVAGTLNVYVMDGDFYSCAWVCLEVPLTQGLSGVGVRVSRAAEGAIRLGQLSATACSRLK